MSMFILVPRSNAFNSINFIKTKKNENLLMILDEHYHQILDYCRDEMPLLNICNL